jgi:hypothetical protein
MDRMEILRLALGASKDAREAMTLAREMAEFIAPSEGLPEPETPMGASEYVAPPHRHRNQKILDTTRPKARKAWSDEDKSRAASMLDAGASYADAGKVIGRSARAVQAMRSAGELPVKTHRLNDIRRMSGALGALAQGFKLNGGSTL